MCILWERSVYVKNMYMRTTSEEASVDGEFSGFDYEEHDLL